MYDELIQKAQHYYNIKKYDQALSAINEVLAEQPNDGYALYVRARCLNDSNQFQEALESCQESFRFGYDLEEINCLFATIYLNLLDFYKSEQHVLETLRLNPQNVSAIALYSLVMFKAGYLEKSDALMAKAMELDPLNNEVIIIRQQIKRDFSEINTFDVDGLIDLGNYHLEKKQYKKAREYYRQAFVMQPNNDSLLEVLSALDEMLSPMHFPLRVFWYIHPGAIWIGFIVIIVLLNRLGYNTVAFSIAIPYIIFVIYSWIASPLYKYFHRKDNNR